MLDRRRRGTAAVSLIESFGTRSTGMCRPSTGLVRNSAFAQLFSRIAVQVEWRSRPRFGFRPAFDYAFYYGRPEPEASFFAIELVPGAGRGGGHVRYAPAFDRL